MAYLVRITARAERDLEDIYTYIEAEESDAAFAWFRGLTQKIFSLETLPNRNPVTPEDPKFRHLLFGHKPHMYRIVYRVTEEPKLVEIMQIRHGAMKPFQPEDV
jgi:toxin ParE1/3/4